ncbi:MAG: preprotein translocase subunit YajC [Bacteroidales bacterium]|nr:preprotein translocase subunit YajC [Bacteroidales bacterium]MCB9012863.1 preprotein translocase subunit YajC [Bacteroidales bacterium]
MNQLLVLLQAPAGASNPLTSLLPLVLIIVVFYFFMIRPQVKRQKELKNYRASLQKGDKIITTGGMYGKITDVKETTVTIEIAENVRIRVDKAAVLKDPSDLETVQK